MIFQQILEKIKKHDSFLVVAHINPEGDAIGSQLAVANLLKRMGKKVSIINSDPVPKNIGFLPGTDEIKLYKDLKNEKVNFEVAIILDSPTLDRIGEVKDLVEDKFIINIDHHISNCNFGQINFVDEHCSSVGEIIFDLFESSELDIDEESALFIYVAIMTDTGSFRYTNTTAKTHQIAARLLSYNINPKDVFEKVYETKSFATFKLLAEVLTNLKKTEDSKFVWFKITKEMLKRNQLGADCCEDFIAFVRMIEGSEVVAFLRELDEGNKVKVSFRSKTDVDVNKIARVFGGGGHKAASGCVIEKHIDEAEKMVLEEVKKVLN